MLSDGTPAFVTTSRKFQVWGDVPKGDRPALRLRQRNQNYMRNPQFEAAPAKATLDAELWIYTSSNASDQTDIPAIQMNDILDAIDRALVGHPVTGVETLNGIVAHCWIEGDIIEDPGDLDGDGVVTVPIKILVPT